MKKLFIIIPSGRSSWLYEKGIFNPEPNNEKISKAK
jgi:hypothetical protein